MAPDASNGYEEFAETFIRARNSRIGPEMVRRWSRTLPAGCAVLELGCGHGVISQVLVEEGFELHAVDASRTLLAAFRKRFPSVPADLAAAEDSDYFGRGFDAVVAWGLMFLLPAETQRAVLGKVARALNPGGRFLFTAPEEVCAWRDSITDRESVSLGAVEYRGILREHGLVVTGHDRDQGGNFYYFASKP